MYAKVGDKIVVRGNRVAEPERDAVVVEGRSPGSGTTSS